MKMQQWKKAPHSKWTALFSSSPQASFQGSRGTMLLYMCHSSDYIIIAGNDGGEKG